MRVKIVTTKSQLFEVKQLKVLRKLRQEEYTLWLE